MFDPTIRYASLPTSTFTVTGADGRETVIRYVLRRFIPAPGATRLASHRVDPAERLDHLAARYLGDAAAFWRIADANLSSEPESLTDRAGSVLHINLPGF